MRSKTLKEILKQHREWLAGTGKGKKADLRDSDLRGADLGDSDLRGALLGGANLRCANLRCAVLSDAYLGDAYLRGADLRGAYLRGAHLKSANLRGAYLRGADLSDAYLRGADLGNADLIGADLGGIKIRTNNRSSLDTSKFFVNIFDGDIIKIGCMTKTLAEWQAVTESECLLTQCSNTWGWWVKHRDIIFAICDSLK